MSFLAPQWLWWMMGAAVPIIIHLWHKKERQPIRFFSLRFVSQRSHAQQFSAVHQWLLLLLRVLIVLCLALAMSEPVVQWQVDRTESVHFVHPRAPLNARSDTENTRRTQTLGDADSTAWYWLCDDEQRTLSQKACNEPVVSMALLHIAKAMPEIKKLTLHLPDGPFYSGRLPAQLPFELQTIEATSSNAITQPHFTVKAPEVWQALLKAANRTHHYERWQWLDSGVADVVLDASYLSAKVHWHSKDDLLWSSRKGAALDSYVDGDVLHIKVGDALVSWLEPKEENATPSEAIDAQATDELAALLSLSYQWLTRHEPPLLEMASMGRATFAQGQNASRTVSLFFVFWLLAMAFLVAERTLSNVRGHASV